jgi:hypothetical protein
VFLRSILIPTSGSSKYLLYAVNNKIERNICYSILFTTTCFGLPSGHNQVLNLKLFFVLIIMFLIYVIHFRAYAQYSKRDPTYAQCYCLFINLVFYFRNMFRQIAMPSSGGIITNCIRCASNGNYKTVKYLKILKWEL